MNMLAAQDLLDLLPIVADGTWRLKPSGAIRDGDGRCPLCALAVELGADSTYIQDWLGSFGDTYGLDLDQRMFYGAGKAVAYAADRDDYLRPALMAALGMEPA